MENNKSTEQAIANGLRYISHVTGSAQKATLTAIMVFGQTEPERHERIAELQRLYRERRVELAPLFPDTDDIPALLDQVDDLKRCLDSFRPLDPEQARQLEQDFAYRYT